MNKLPRVLLLNYEFPPMGGGAGHMSFQLAKTLVAVGCQVDVVTSGIGGQSRAEDVNGVNVYRVPSLRRNIQHCGFLGAWWYVVSAQPVVKRLLRESHYDIVHYFFGLPTGLLALCTPGITRVPSVVSMRGSDVPGYNDTDRVLKLAHRILRPLTRKIWRQAGAVVALSASLRDQALRTSPNQTISIIPNGIDVSIFHPAQGNGRAQTKRVQVLAVARLVRRKGLEDLLQAMVRLKDAPVDLVIQGSGQEEMQLEKLVVTLGLQERVSLLGFCSRDRLTAVYQAADIFVMPSLSEAFGNAAIEAMACGLPVVVTRVGGMVGYVEDNVNGFLVPPRDPEALAQALRRLINDPNLRATMGAANAQKIQQAYTQHLMAERYLQLYRRLIHDRAQGAHHARA